MKIDDIDKEFQALSVYLKDGDEALRQGNLEQAETLYEQAYATVKEFGNEHPDADACISKLADVYYSRRRYADATDLLLTLYEIRVQQLGAEHPSLVQLLFRVAKCFERQKCFEEAELAYTRAIGRINYTGIPDRAAAAAVVEGYARMLRTIEGRESDAENLEEQARDLRDLTREKLNIEIISKISFAEHEALDAPIFSTSGIRSLRRRAGDEFLEPKSRVPTKIIISAIVSVMLLCSVAAFYVVNVVAEQKEAAKKRAAKTAAAAFAQKLVPASVVYLSADGGEQLILFSNGDATYECGGETKKGKYSESGGSLVLKVSGGKETLRYQKDASGFADGNGVIMYRPDARELQLVQAMKSMAASMQAAYHAGGDYLVSVPTYENPFTGKIEAPKIDNIGSMTREVNFERLQQWQEQINQIQTWTQWSTGRPGLINVYHYASGENGDTLFIKGTDAHGTYLRSSAPQAPYLIQLANGDFRY